MSNYDSASGSKSGFAVIELFTSQGCSSCPAADRLLGKYTEKENVYALSFHVDYWNKLGWKDPFSDAAFTQRQSMYADKLNSNIYTPQAVINGQTEMIGSNETGLASAVNKSLSEVSSTQINISNIQSVNTEVTFDYDLQNKAEKAVLNVALVQNKIITSIKRGENEGLNLSNYNVVRSFKIIDLDGNKSNHISLQLPAGFYKDDFKIIAFVQMKKTYKILAATKVSL
jgi:hypothetical protein